MKLLLFFLMTISVLEVQGNFVVGTFGPPLDRVRDTADETQGPFSLNPYIGLFYRTQNFGAQSFSFEFDYVFPQESYEDMQEPITKRRRLIFQADMNYLFYGDFLYAIAGLSTVITKVYGDGSSVTVAGDNFFSPGEDGDSSYNTIINLGLGTNFNGEYFGEFKAHIWEILDSQSRAISLSLAFKARLF